MANKSFHKILTDKILPILILLLVVTAVPCCIDTFDIKLPERPPSRMVINGFVERGEVYAFEVTVSRTLPINDSLQLIREPSEIVIIANNRETVRLDNGIPLKISVDEFHALYGGTPESTEFTLQVASGDNVFESEPQAILSVPKPSHLNINLIERTVLNDAGNQEQRQFVRLYINTSLTSLINANSQKVSLKWDVSGIYSLPDHWTCGSPTHIGRICYIPHNTGFNKINMLEFKDVHGDYVQQHEINEIEIDFKFHSGYYYTVLQKSLTPQAANYWSQIEVSIMKEGSIFDVNPGKVVSNIRNINNPDEEIVGFFYGSALDTVRLFASPEATGHQKHPCDPLNYNPALCCECLFFLRSSLNKPHYWK